MVSLLRLGHVVGGVEGADDEVLFWVLFSALDQVVLHPLGTDLVRPVVRAVQQAIHDEGQARAGISGARATFFFRFFSIFSPFIANFNDVI